MKNIFTFSLLLGLCSLSHANPTDVLDNRIPKFSSYLVDVYKGKTAQAKLETKYEKEYATRLKSAIQEPVNFAGEYVIASIGCGTNCRFHPIINKRTGKLLDLNAPIGGEGGSEIVFNDPKSRLLVTAEDNTNPDDYQKKIKFSYYVVKNERMSLIYSEDINLWSKSTN